jgi:hypothetical protein
VEPSVGLFTYIFYLPEKVLYRLFLVLFGATAKVMSNTPPDVADDKRNNCPVTINYVNKQLYCKYVVNLSFCWQADKKYYNKIVNTY